MLQPRFLIIVALLGTLSLNSFGQRLISDSSEAEHKFTDWAGRNAIQLKTTVPGDDFSDMAPLGGVVGDARIVELGEATHGTSEFFEMKDRMVRYLATQKGFTIFSIEANMPEAYRLNDYVLNGVGDPKALLKGMYFWTWNTREVLDMILWMRQYNFSGKGRIEFTGFDMQTPTLSLENVRQFVTKYDPAYVPELAKAYKGVGQTASQSFGVATAQIPVSVAAGHRITLSGYIKTENIEGGFAGLWVRADRAQGKPGAFDGMDNRGPKGTTSWTKYEVTISAPADASAIYFGLVHPGTGTAWFDSLQIEIDGVPYSDSNAFDLDFESSTPRGFHLGGEGYREEIDSTNAHTGKQSLRIDRTAASSDPSVNIPEESRKLQLCRGVLDDVSARRAEYSKAGASAHEIEWAIQSARLLVQYEQMNVEGVAARDRAMAENIEWIASRNPKAKIVVWAHNGHVSYQDYGNTPAMGGYLKRYFGPQVVNFGFIFNQGSFRASDAEKHQLVNFTVTPSSDGTWVAALAATRIPLFALNLRVAALAPEAAAWLEEPHRTRTLGAVYDASSANNYWYETQLQKEFDAIFFVEKTTASHGLP